MNGHEKTLLYLDPMLSVYGEVRAILHMLGVPITHDPLQAHVHVSRSAPEGRVSLFESDRNDMIDGQGFFDQHALRTLFRYKRQVMLAKVGSYYIPVGLDAFRKTDSIAAFVSILLRLLQYHHLPLVFLWFFPRGSQGVMNYRIDVDDRKQGTVEAVLDQVGQSSSWSSWFFTTSNFEEDPAIITSIAGRGAEVGSHAHYHFTYERDGKSNRRNARTSIRFLRSLGIDVHGFTTPTAKSFVDIGQMLSENGIDYTSNFGFLYDALPLDIPSRDSSYLEVPIHPPCPGNFFKAQANPGIADEELFRYAQTTARRLSDAYLPIFFYGHNNDHYRLSYLSEFLRWAPNAFPNHERVTLGGYARFWRSRLAQLRAFAEGVHVDNVAILSPDHENRVLVTFAGRTREYPFSLETFLCSPLHVAGNAPKPAWYTRFLVDHELEQIVPYRMIDPRSWQGIKKILFKFFHELWHKRF